MLKTTFIGICFLTFSLSFFSQSKKDIEAEIEAKINETLTFSSIKSNADTIRKISLSVLEKAIEINDSLSLVSLYNNIGVSYFLESNYNKSLQHFYQSVSYINGKNRPKEKGIAFHNISQIHDLNGSPEKAILYSNKSIELLQIAKAKPELSSAFLNKGLLETFLENYGNAKQSFEKSLNIKLKLKDSIGIANCRNNIGVAELELKEFEKALKNFLYASNMFYKLNIVDPLLQTTTNIFSCHDELNNHDSAKFYVDSISVLLELHDFDLESEQSTYQILSQYFEKETLFEEALIYKNLYLKVKHQLDSISKSSNDYLELEKEFLDSQVINQNTTEKENSNSYSRILYFVLGLVILLILILLFVKKRNKKEAKLIQDIAEVAKQNLTDREIEILNLLLSGKSNSFIAEQLFISINTVKTHRKNIYKKLDVKSSSELLLWNQQNQKKQL